MVNFTIKLVCSFLFFSISFFAQAQEREVKGKVTDNETGEILPGVNILVKGTTQGTTSDANGEFKLSVSPNSTLVFSFIGYQTQEAAVANLTILNVTLVSDIKSLEEVVVVGYGTQRKVDLTGAVGSLRASDIDIGSKPITSADQLLAGRVAGVQITNRSGDPGAPIDVRIRGVGTAGVNSPLWVIDGVPIVQTSNITVNTSSTVYYSWHYLVETRKRQISVIIICGAYCATQTGRGELTVRQIYKNALQPITHQGNNTWRSL